MGYLEIERPEAKYRAIFNVHSREISASDLPQRLDALFIETYNFNYDEFKERDGWRLRQPERASRSFIESLKIAKNFEARIYFGDVPLSGMEIFNQRISWPTFLRLIEFFAGYCTLVSVNKHITKKKLNRRDFLRLGAKGLLGAWGASNLAKLSGFLIARPGKINSVAKALNEIDDRLHPEDLDLNLRNSVMADKMMYIGERLASQLSRKPEIAISGGAAHSRLMEFVKAGPEFCQKVILSYPWKYLRPAVAGGNLEYLSLVVGLDYHPRFDLWIVQEKFHNPAIQGIIRKEFETGQLGKERLI